MHSSCILDFVANLLVCHMVLIGNIQEFHIASHLKGLDPSLDFCCQGPALTGIKVVVSKRSTRTPAFSSSSAFTTMSSAKRKLVISRPPMLTLSSWLSKASHMILSRKMLKRVGESRHPCRTPTVVLNQDCTLGLVIQIFNGSYDAGVDVVFPRSCP